MQTSVLKEDCTTKCSRTSFGRKNAVAQQSVAWKAFWIVDGRVRLSDSPFTAHFRGSLFINVSIEEMSGAEDGRRKGNFMTMVSLWEHERKSLFPLSSSHEMFFVFLLSSRDDNRKSPTQKGVKRVEEWMKTKRSERGSRLAFHFWSLFQLIYKSRGRERKMKEKWTARSMGRAGQRWEGNFPRTQDEDTPVSAF